MNLSVYLSELLKTNDCVIVPDLGGFIANYHSSAHDTQSDQFSPPSKEIIFSSKLKKNDGLLVNFVGEKEGVGYLEARKIVSEYVAECLFRLENGETIEFSEIGTLHFDQHENLLFKPDSRINFRTDTFGLDSFHFPQLINKYNQPVKAVFRDKDPEPQKSRRPALKYILIGLPVIVALYFIPLNKILDAGKSGNLQTSNTASLSVTDTPVTLNPGVVSAATATATGDRADSGIPEKEVGKETLAAEPETLTGQVTITPSAAQAQAPQTENALNANSDIQSPKGKYHVVGGCFKVRENADKLADELIKKGYHAEISKMGKEFYRVSVESFQTRKEAETELAKILDADPDAGYWLMVDKN
jgi:hypothetical protein